MNRAFAAVVALALAAAASLTPAQRATASVRDSIEAKRAQIDATRHALAGRRSLLTFETVRTADLHRQLVATGEGIARVGSTLAMLDANVRHTERNLSWNRVQLDAARSTLARHDGALRRRLVDAYERGDLGYVNVILSSTSFGDFVERWDDIRYLIAANERTVRERRDAERAVAGARADLERREAALRDDVERRRQTQYELTALAQERTQLLAVADAHRRSVAVQVAQLEGLSAAEESALEALIRQRQREEAARLAAAEASRRRAAQLSGERLAPPVAPGAPGDFSWPASGPITSPFGMRSDPNGRGFRMHTGVDIGAPMGATITATAGGRVIFAGTYGAYGNAIIIDHGGRMSSLYGHCSQIFVANGQDVQRGQAIGAVGATGDATGPHLHFEIRIDGVPVEPTSRLH